MKFAVHLSIFQRKWGDELSPLIFLAKEIGFDGFELPLMNPFDLELKPIQEAIKETNLVPLCSTGLSQLTDISSTDEKVRENGIKHLKKCIDISHQIGSHYLNGLTFSPWGFLQSKDEGKENIEIMIDSLYKVANYALSKDVILNVEVVNRYETYVMNTVEEALDVLNRVNHPNIGIHYDTFHANIEEKSQYDAIKLGGSKIKHIHFASNYRGTPGKGTIDFSGIAKAIKEIEYNDFISLENAVEPNCEVGNGFNTWRLLEESNISAAKNGLKSMREIMK